MSLAVHWLDRIDAVPATDWNALCGDDHPFVAHAFLNAIEASDSLRSDLGWCAEHLTLWRDNRLVAAAPTYRKANSHGEFVFDFAFADAYERSIGNYYPKRLVAVPYSPVTGPRLLASTDADRRALVATLATDTVSRGWSSAHVNFLRESECDAFDEQWLPRCDWQFHWHNHGYRDFDDFLDALNAKKRKNIRQERARLLGNDWRFERRHGQELEAEHIDFLHRCYVLTFADKGNTPSLTRDFFARICRDLPRQTLAVFAYRGDQLLASSFLLQSANVLYGRYWGGIENAPGLHFETCYYQGIEHAIAQGLSVFEPGAQGEHKIARGFLPTRTHSRHFFAHPGFRNAIADYLKREARELDHYRDAVLRHSPYGVTA
ncbi:MAG: GNAT family N-acetyltransferase [Rhodanobacteraceae bacterium]|nr:GNAT family N-acetyltransferase [Rhodanobacteraceae bacterium]